jgi:hypothetical protein
VYYGLPGLAAYLGILVDTVADLWRRVRSAAHGLDGRLLPALVGAMLIWGIVEDSLSGPLTMPAFTLWLVVGWMRARPADAPARVSERSAPARSASP